MAYILQISIYIQLKTKICLYILGAGSPSHHLGIILALTRESLRSIPCEGLCFLTSSIWNHKAILSITPARKEPDTQIL